jgi:hypothetical protein
MEKDSATIIAAEVTVTAYAARYEESLEIKNKNSADSATTTLVAIYQAEREYFSDRIHIELPESVRIIAQLLIASASSAKNITKHQDMRWTY